MDSDATRVMRRPPHDRRYPSRRPGSPLVAWLNQPSRMCVEAIAALVGEGACIDARDAQGCSPLQLMARQGHLAAVKFLVGRGAPVNALDRRGFTALAEAAWHEHSCVVHYLRSRGANPNAVAPLLCGARQGRLGTVEMFLQHGCNVNLRDRAGNTALIWAARTGQLAVAKALLQWGAGRRLRNGRGHCALVAAVMRRHYRLAAMLETGHDCFVPYRMRHLRYIWQTWWLPKAA